LSSNAKSIVGILKALFPDEALGFKICFKTKNRLRARSKINRGREATRRFWVTPAFFSQRFRFFIIYRSFSSFSHCNKAQSRQQSSRTRCDTPRLEIRIFPVFVRRRRDVEQYSPIVFRQAARECVRAFECKIKISSGDNGPRM